MLEEPNESEIGEAIDENPENTEGDADATLDRDNGSNQNHNTETVSTPNTEKRKSLFQSPKAKRTPNKKSRSDEAYSILKQTVENRNHRDESAIFGEHVANKHRKYNQHTRSIVEHLIADIFFKADMGDYEKNTQNWPSSNCTPYTTPIPSPSPTYSSSEYSQSVSHQSHASSSFIQNDTFSNTDSYPSCSTLQSNGNRLVNYINTFTHDNV